MSSALCACAVGRTTGAGRGTGARHVSIEAAWSAAAAGPGRACASLPSQPQARPMPARRPKHGPGAGAAAFTAFLRSCGQTPVPKGDPSDLRHGLRGGHPRPADHADHQRSAGVRPVCRHLYRQLSPPSRASRPACARPPSTLPPWTPSRSATASTATPPAILGVETNFGRHGDGWDVIRSLATLASARWRHPFFATS